MSHKIWRFYSIFTIDGNGKQMNWFFQLAADISQILFQPNTAYLRIISGKNPISKFSWRFYLSVYWTAYVGPGKCDSWRGKVCSIFCDNIWGTNRFHSWKLDFIYREVLFQVFSTWFDNFVLKRPRKYRLLTGVYTLDHIDWKSPKF